MVSEEDVELHKFIKVEQNLHHDPFQAKTLNELNKKLLSVSNQMACGIENLIHENDLFIKIYLNEESFKIKSNVLTYEIALTN